MTTAEIISATLAGLGYECVDTELTSGGILRVFIDRDGGITIADCTRASAQLTRVLAVEDVAYKTLEVSSPGLDRVLKKATDFTRFQGALVNIKLRPDADGQKKISGRLVRFRDNIALIEDEKQEKSYEIAWEDIERARLKPEL